MSQGIKWGVYEGAVWFGFVFLGYLFFFCKLSKEARDVCWGAAGLREADARRILLGRADFMHPWLKALWFWKRLLVAGSSSSESSALLFQSYFWSLGMFVLARGKSLFLFLDWFSWWHCFLLFYWFVCSALLLSPVCSGPEAFSNWQNYLGWVKSTVVIKGIKYQVAF